MKERIKDFLWLTFWMLVFILFAFAGTILSLFIDPPLERVKHGDTYTRTNSKHCFLMYRFFLCFARLRNCSLSKEIKTMG